jgi:hypothetical protein
MGEEKGRRFVRMDVCEVTEGMGIGEGLVNTVKRH